MKPLKIDGYRIISQKTSFTFSYKDIDYKSYESYKIVYEASENGTFEALWLIKDGKLEDSFQLFNIRDIRY